MSVCALLSCTGVVAKSSTYFTTFKPPIFSIIISIIFPIILPAFFPAMFPPRERKLLLGTLPPPLPWK